jgi:hypothetical protein
MEPLLNLNGIRRQTRSVPWNICLLGFVLSMQVATFILVLVLILSIAPIVPDLMRVIHIVDATLSDVQIMLPEMNGTLWDLNHVLPGIRQTIYYTEAICKHTSGCLGYK